MTPDSALPVAAPPAPLALVGLDQAFQQHQFVIDTAFAVADKRTISDRLGKPILRVTSPSRLGRLVVGVLGAVAVFMVLDCAVVLTLATVVHLDTTSFLVLVATLLMTSAVVALMVFFAILGRPCYRFVLADGAGQPVVRMQPDVTPGFSTCYTVLDGQGGCLGRLRTNYITNSWRTRWYAEDSEGNSLLVVEEDSALPGFLRRPLRSGVALLLLLLTLGGTLLLGQGPVGLVLLVLFWLLPLGALLLRRLLPDYVYYKPNRASVVGVLRHNRRVTRQGWLLNLESDQLQYLDRRLALALAVVLFEQ